MYLLSRTQMNVLLLLNKQDVAIDSRQDNQYWLERLEVSRLQNDIVVEKSSATNGEGIKLGFSKLLKLLERKFTGQILQSSEVDK